MKNNKKVSIFFAAALLFVVIMEAEAQVAFGPNNPSQAVNNSSIGTNAWSVPGNTMANDGAYATQSTQGLTQYLSLTDFGFNIPATYSIVGIEANIERRTVGSNVAINNNWTTGLTKTITAGSSRCLIVVAALENGSGAEDITSFTYGGQAMTQAVEIAAGDPGGFNAKIEVWYLLEAGIAAASSTTLSPTITPITQTENVRFYSSAVFNNVDQTSPISGLNSAGSASAVNPFQVSFQTTEGGMAVTAVMCGNNTTPASTNGGTNTFSVNSSMVEGTDIYFSNPSFATSGACLQTATRQMSTSGTLSPSFTFNGTVNRISAIGICLQRTRQLDHSVRLIQNGSVAGSNYAKTTVAWPLTASYATYGSSSDLWGLGNWDAATVNDPGFGIALSALVQGGTVEVDHVSITVYAQSTLPVELIDFWGALRENAVELYWATASEINCDRFEIERSTDGRTFKQVGVEAGAGQSKVVRHYQYRDADPPIGVIYYRLRQVDFDGKYEYSELISINRKYDGDILVYPNPAANGKVTISSKEGKPGDLNIYSLDHRLIKTISGVSSGHDVDISDCPDGEYFFIFSGSEGNCVRKVLKVSRGN